jgi:hypothetical protein
MKPEVVNVCVECAESVVGLDFAMGVMPCHGVDVRKKYFGPFIEHGAKRLGNVAAVISYGDLSFTVVRLANYKISFKEARGEEHRADNIFEAWSRIRHEITGPGKADVVPFAPRSKRDWFED